MKNDIRDKKAAKDLSVFVIIKDNKLVAKVLFHYSDSGTVICNVFDNNGLSHVGKAGGGGYDKTTSSIAGAVIEGITIYDHCEKAEITKEIEDLSYEEAKKVIDNLGMSISNYNGVKFDVYFKSGLDRLRDFGYKVYHVL